MDCAPVQTKDLPPVSGIRDAHVLLNLEDSVTTDHISPAGSIARSSSAAKYLTARQCVNARNIIVIIIIVVVNCLFFG